MLCAFLSFIAYGCGTPRKYPGFDFHLTKSSVQSEKNITLSNSSETMNSHIVLKGVIYVIEAQLVFASDLCIFYLLCVHFCSWEKNTKNGMENLCCNTSQWLTSGTEDLVQDLQNLWMSIVCQYNFQQSNTVFFKHTLILPMEDIGCADSEFFY